MSLYERLDSETSALMPGESRTVFTDLGWPVKVHVTCYRNGSGNVRYVEFSEGDERGTLVSGPLSKLPEYLKERSQKN